MRKITVLIVDDEITVLQGLKNLFGWEKNGYAIVGEAMDGVSTLNLTFEVRPDIVLMDINMPLMSGLDVVSRIRESLPQTVSIMISGYSDAHYMRQAIRHGVFDYILKPISFEDLSETLERARMHILGHTRSETAPPPAGAGQDGHSESGLLSEQPHFRGGIAEGALGSLPHESELHQQILQKRDGHELFGLSSGAAHQ